MNKRFVTWWTAGNMYIHRDVAVDAFEHNVNQPNERRLEEKPAAIDGRWLDDLLFLQWLPTQACMRMFGRCVANGAGGNANSEFRSPNGFGTVPEAVGSVVHSPSTTKRYS